MEGGHGEREVAWDSGGGFRLAGEVFVQIGVEDAGRDAIAGCGWRGRGVEELQS